VTDANSLASQPLRHMRWRRPELRCAAAAVSGYPAHSCPAGSKKCRAVAGASPGLHVQASARLGARLALGGLGAELLNGCQACIRVAVICLSSSHRRPYHGRNRCRALARRHGRIEQHRDHHDLDRASDHDDVACCSSSLW